MLDTLITSKTRIKLLLKFFLNAQTKSYLRSLEGEFGESTNAIRLELNKFEEIQKQMQTQMNLLVKSKNEWNQELSQIKLK